MTRAKADRSTHWSTLVESLRDPAVEHVISGAAADIMCDAATADVLPRALAVQTRLHLPSLSREQLTGSSPTEVYDSVRTPSLLRAYAMRRAEEEAQLRANVSLFIAPRTVRRERGVELADGRTVRLRFGPVSARVGHEIQKHLHYMRSPRGDTHREYGIFLPGADHPITYVAFSPCDREYISDCLHRQRLSIPQLDTLVLTRMYTLPDMPRNLISMTLRHAVREIRQERHYSAVVTAFNPFLGFTGAAFRASGFQPAASAPVTYSYRSTGEYATRRQGGRHSLQRLDTPHNLLVAKGVRRDTQRALLYCGAMTEVDPDTYRIPDRTDTSPTEKPVMDGPELVTLRKALEAAWSTDTVHPSYLSGPRNGPPSRGQCGVSSVMLLKELRARGATQAVYCFGDVEFADREKDTVRHHCWVEYGQPDDVHRYVIDITSDQSEHLGTEILSEPISSLADAGVNYVASARLTLDDLPTDRVWSRVLRLEESMSRLRDTDVRP